MVLNEIVRGHKDGHSVPLIGQLARPAQAEPGEATVERPNRKIGPLNVTGADHPAEPWFVVSMTLSDPCLNQLLHKIPNVSQHV